MGITKPGAGRKVTDEDGVLNARRNSNSRRFSTESWLKCRKALPGRACLVSQALIQFDQSV